MLNKKYTEHCHSDKIIFASAFGGAKLSIWLTYFWWVRVLMCGGGGGAGGVVFFVLSSLKLFSPPDTFHGVKQTPTLVLYEWCIHFTSCVGGCSPLFAVFQGIVAVRREFQLLVPFDEWPRGGSGRAELVESGTQLGEERDGIPQNTKWGGHTFTEAWDTPIYTTLVNQTLPNHTRWQSQL